MGKAELKLTQNPGKNSKVRRVGLFVTRESIPILPHSSAPNRTFKTDVAQQILHSNGTENLRARPIAPLRQSAHHFYLTLFDKLSGRLQYRMLLWRRPSWPLSKSRETHSDSRVLMEICLDWKL